MKRTIVLGRGGRIAVIPEYFEHITLNTGHTSRSYRSELKADTLITLRRIATDALKPSGVEIVDNIVFQATQEEDSYVGTLFYRYDTANVPFLTTGGAKTKAGGEELWRLLHTTNFGDGEKMKTSEHQMPGIPFVADRLLGSMTSQAVSFVMSGMSGDFCRCMGWLYLYPEIIKEANYGPSPNR